MNLYFSFHIFHKSIVIIIIFTYFRSQQNAVIRLQLSDQVRNMRKRTLMVNIEIQALAWALEFVAGNSTTLILLLEGTKIKKWVLLMDVLTFYILIPATYVINRDITKQIIILNDWSKGIKSIFVSDRKKQTESPAV